jgi:hypothetical protein
MEYDSRCSVRLHLEATKIGTELRELERRRLGCRGRTVRNFEILTSPVDRGEFLTLGDEVD